MIFTMTLLHFFSINIYPQFYIHILQVSPAFKHIRFVWLPEVIQQNQVVCMFRFLNYTSALIRNMSITTTITTIIGVEYIIYCFD